MMKSLDEILKMGDPGRYLYEYAYINGRLEPKWEELLLLLGDLHWIHWYAYCIISRRWFKAEEIIRKDPEYAYYYARDIIESRWLEAEEIIKKDSTWAYYYAANIIGERWLEAEEYIKKDLYWQLYCEHFNVEEYDEIT